MPVELSELSFAQRVMYRIGNAVTCSVLWAVLRLPYRWRVPLTGWVADRVAGRPTGFYKRIRKNLLLTHPDMPEDDIKRLCHAVTDNAGRTLIEMYSARDLSARLDAIEIEGSGYDAFLKARQEGKAVILASAHFGNYIALRAKLHSDGHSVAGLYRRMANPYFNKHYVAAMKETGEVMFEQGAKGMREMIRHVRTGGIVAILHDLHVHGGKELSFFGLPAVTSITTAELALKYEVDVIPCYAIRAPNGLDFRLVMSGPVTPSDPETMTQDLNDDLEHMVRAHMGQWFWVHRRWKPWYGLGHPEG